MIATGLSTTFITEIVHAPTQALLVPELPVIDTMIIGEDPFDPL